MKNLSILIAVLLAASGFMSCEDFINLDSRDQLPASQALNNIEGLEATMIQVYERCRALHEDNEISVHKVCGTDIIKAGTNLVDGAAGGMPAMNAYNNSLSPVSDQILSIWDTYYTALDRCNRVIQAADIIEPGSESEANQLERFKG